jgi:hypothetical protein
MRGLFGFLRSLGGPTRAKAARLQTKSDRSDGEVRERLIRRVLSTIRNNSILLCGGAGSGKTSILLDLKDRLSSGGDPATEFFPAYLNLDGVPEHLLFATVADAVLEQLTFAPPTKVERYGSDYGHRELVGDFRQVIRTLTESTTRSARLVLLVDRIDQLNTYDPRTTQRVRGLFMTSLDGGLVMVATAVEIDKRWEQEGSPWYNFFEEIALPEPPAAGVGGVGDRATMTPNE